MTVRATPVPIPNTMVKPYSADDTAWEAVWESRLMPVQQKYSDRFSGYFFFNAEFYYELGFNRIFWNQLHLFKRIAGSKLITIPHRLFIGLLKIDPRVEFS